MNSQDNKSVHILIVEDDAIISHDLSLILKKQEYIVAGIANNSTKAIDLLSKTTFDLAILDIHLGKGKTGIDLAEIINEKYNFPYIFLTSFSDQVTLTAAQEQGPYGYLVKPFQEATLLSTISLALSNFRRQKQQFNIDKIRTQLSEKEALICKELYDGKSYQEIANETFISINTVRYHVKNLYQKFDVNSRAELIRMLIE